MMNKSQALQDQIDTLTEDELWSNLARWAQHYQTVADRRRKADAEASTALEAEREAFELVRAAKSRLRTLLLTKL